MDASHQALIFVLGQHRYAIDLHHLVEVARISVTDLEAAGPASLPRLVRLHGRPVQVHELRPSLVSGAPAAPPPPSPYAWLVVTRDEIGGGRHWRVDAVEDIVDFDPHQAMAMAPSAADGTGGTVLDLDGQLLPFVEARVCP